MLGGHWFEELFGSPDSVELDTVSGAALQALDEHLGILGQPSHIITKVLKVSIILCDCLFR